MDKYEDVFERYGSHRPTTFDRHINIDDEDESREDWFLMPVSRTRDSQPLDNVNFDEFLKGLGGECDTVEVHRFGHWGPGWYEIIIVSPKDAKALDEAYDMARALQNYPVLNEEALSEAEYEAAQESWDNWARRDVESYLESSIENYLNDESDSWECDPSDIASELIDAWVSEHGLPEYETHSDGAHFDIGQIAEAVFKTWDQTIPS